MVGRDNFPGRIRPVALLTVWAMGYLFSSSVSSVADDSLHRPQPVSAKSSQVVLCDVTETQSGSATAESGKDQAVNGKAENVQAANVKTGKGQEVDFAADGRSRTSDAEVMTEDLVFLGGSYPVFVRLVALIDGQEIRSTRSKRLSKIILDLDDDKNGRIDQAEREAHPKALRSLGVPEKWANLLPLIDRSPLDQSISFNELAAFISERFGPPVTLGGRIRRGNQAVELFDLLDADHDQRLSLTEFGTMPSRLNKLDSDGDDAFSIVEVEPFRNPFGVSANVVSNSDDLPWTIAKGAAERILSRFDASKDSALSASELGLPTTAISEFDQNRNNTLELGEVQTWLLAVKPHFKMTSRAFKKKAGRTEIVWEEMSEALTEDAKKNIPSRERQSSKNRNEKSARVAGKTLEVKLADLPLQLQITSAARGFESDSISFYRNQFRRADGDKNKYLDKTEFVQLSGLGATFEMVDVDDNAQIYEPELIDYLSLETASEQSRVILLFDRNEQSLFSLLDRNSDRRLTAREMLSAAERWRPFDHDEDGVLNRVELSGTMRLTVELPKPKLFQQIANPTGDVGRDPVISAQQDGPVWFQGMDRNKDGDVSELEFLGTESQFQKWDRNGDGLISKAEASS